MNILKQCLAPVSCDKCVGKTVKLKSGVVGGIVGSIDLDFGAGLAPEGVSLP